MKAFHGKEEIKSLYVTQVLAHQEADEIVKGKYWENGKGCAIGCTLHSSNHEAYETKLGVPEWLARVEDKLFEGMSNERSKVFPLQFLKAINVGTDLEKIKGPSLVFVLQHTLEKFDHVKFPDCKRAIDTVISLHDSGETDLAKYRAAYAASNATSASNASNASNAASYAASYAAYATSASNASNAAYAIYAASAPAYPPNAANAISYAAAYAANVAGYEKFADKLLELIRECK